MGISDGLVLQITKPAKLYNSIRDLQQYCSTTDYIDHQNPTFPKNFQPEKKTSSTTHCSQKPKKLSKIAHGGRC